MFRSIAIGSGRFSLILLASLTVLLGFECGQTLAADGGGQGAQDSAVTPKDPNKVGANDIRSNYLKRFPFAAEAAKDDDTENQKSQGSGSQTYEAYSTVIRFCKDDAKEGNPESGLDIHYQQTPKQVTYQLPNDRYKEVFQKGKIKVYGLPCSDTQYQLIDRENRQRLLELFFDPERWMWTNTTAAHMEALSAANSVGGAAESSFKSAFQSINEPLVNVANEESALGSFGAKKGARTQGQAIFLIQQMYKQVFMPMAVLLLLPGTLLTQCKGLVGFGFLGSKEDASSPFEGFLRALIAVFLIPATQLIVSYSIDVGNSLAGAVRDPLNQWIQPQVVFNWAKEQTFNPPIANVNNGIIQPKGGSNGQGGEAQSQGGNGGTNGGGAQNSGSASGGFFNISFPGTGAIGQQVGSVLSDILNSIFGGIVNSVAVPGFGGQGKSAGQSELKVTAENQLFLSSAMQIAFNGFACAGSFALTILTSYQLVFMCYLFLLGPIAACFFAWPAGCGSLFRNVFTNWLNAVIVLSLWRFYWCVILAVMTQRIISLRPNPSAPEEMMVFSCFLALMMYIPFHPFNFNPGEIVSEMLDKASKGAGQAAGQGAGAGGGNPIGSNPLAQGHALVHKRSNMATVEFVRLSSGAQQHGQSGHGEHGHAHENARRALGKLASMASQGLVKLSRSGRNLALPPMTKRAPMRAVHPEGLPPSTNGAEDGASEHAHPFSNMPHVVMASPEHPGVVPLAPHGSPKYIAMTTKSEHVAAGIKAWQQAADKGGLPRPAGVPPVADATSNGVADSSKGASPTLPHTGAAAEHVEGVSVATVAKDKVDAPLSDGTRGAGVSPLSNSKPNDGVHASKVVTSAPAPSDSGDHARVADGSAKH